MYYALFFLGMSKYLIFSGIQATRKLLHGKCCFKNSIAFFTDFFYFFAICKKAPALVDLSAFENPTDERLSIFWLDGKNVGIWLMACPEDTDYTDLQKKMYLHMHASSRY